MKYFNIILCLLSNYAFANIEYVVCIDGGGSKTNLQVINALGQPITLTQNNKATDAILGTGTNINTVGKDGVQKVFETLFHDLKIDTEQKNIRDILPRCQVIAGMAGAGSAENKDTLISLLQKIGFDRNKIIVTHDGQIAIDLIEKKGVILIAGTGSICMAKKDTATYRVGGLGKVLGDEGSGFTIGKKAIKATLEEEQGWGEKTDLAPALKKFFDVQSLLKLAGPITQGTITSAHIASTAPIVFDRAQAQDKVAVRIINQAAQELSEMLAHIIALSELSNCPIFLYGGIFKSSSSDAFIKKIMEHPQLKNKNLVVINNASKNAALLYARQWIKSL